MTTPDVVSTTTRSPLDNTWPIILEIASVLTERMSAERRFQRLLEAIQALVACDSAALLRLDGDELVPIATIGLVPEAASLRFQIAEHPRLAQFVRTRQPVQIMDHDIPDPFDGLIAGELPFAQVHACMGCALEVGQTLVGVLAIDALEPGAFDAVDHGMLAAIATLAAAAIRTTDLIEELEHAAAHSDQVARDLVRDCKRAGGELLGRSAAMNVLRDDVNLAGRSDLAVLITGETGVGKEVVARAIHAASERSQRPLIYVNCAALPESIAESELFGHVRGAFTGALENRAGKFEIADRGTLFLDEIGELPMAIQPKLLRSLQSGEIQRVGADKTLRVDVRIIAATNRDLVSEVSTGRFRADLFHRLSVYPIHVVPLRERRDDITLLAGYFLDEARLRLGLGRVRLSAAAREALEVYDWPGNVRELEHAILRAALRASGGRRRELVVIEVEHLDVVTRAERPVEVLGMASEPPARDEPLHDEPLHDALERFKRDRIHAAIRHADGNLSEAARRLGLDRGNLHRLAKRLGVHTE